MTQYQILEYEQGRKAQEALLECGDWVHLPTLPPKPGFYEVICKESKFPHPANISYFNGEFFGLTGWVKSAPECYEARNKRTLQPLTRWRRLQSQPAIAVNVPDGVCTSDVKGIRYFVQPPERTPQQEPPPRVSTLERRWYWLPR